MQKVSCRPAGKLRTTLSLLIVGCLAWSPGYVGAAYTPDPAAIVTMTVGADYFLFKLDPNVTIPVQHNCTLADNIVLIPLTAPLYGVLSQVQMAFANARQIRVNLVACDTGGSGYYIATDVEVL